MFRGILTTDISTYYTGFGFSIERTDETFSGILRQMEELRREYVGQNIDGINIYENDKVIASLRTI